MKREVAKEVRLPAFALEPGELKLLWGQLRELFDAGHPCTEELTLSFPSERIKFESIDELNDYDRLHGRCHEFVLRIQQGARSVSIRTGGLFSNVPTLKVEGDTDHWCAGAVEVAQSAIYRNRLWYWWIVRLPIASLFFTFALLPTIYEWMFSKRLLVSVPLAASWASMIFTLGFLALSRDKLLPSASLVFSQNLGFIRRYGAELGLALGLISLGASFLMWIFPFSSG